MANLRQAPSNHNWCENYVDENFLSLKSYCDEFYHNEDIQDDDREDRDVELLMEDLYRPENCKSHEQRILVYHNLYHQWLKYNNRDDEHWRHKTQLVWVEGLPGKWCSQLHI